MNYFLHIRALDAFPQVEIDVHAYEAICAATARLRVARRAEEKYDLVVRNYTDLERTTAEIGLRNLLGQNTGYDEFHDQTQALNARLINLMSTARLYLDSVPKELGREFSEVFADPKDARAPFSEAYEKSPHYRFAESLRNFMQHRDTAIANFKTGGTRPIDEPHHINFQVDYYAALPELVKDSQFKEANFSELGPKINLKTAIRAYVGLLSASHCQNREKTARTLTSLRRTLEDALALYAEQADGKVTGLVACGPDRPDCHVMLDWDNIRVRLESQNRSLHRLEARSHIWE